MKVGIIGDVHLGCADYTERRRADFAQAFTNAVETCLSEGAEAICLLGDVFDSALMRRNVEAFAATMKEVGPLFARLRSERVEVLAIAGNHEFGRGREAGELGVLESLGLLRVLRGDEFVVDGCSIVGLPWHSQEELPALHDTIRSLARGAKSRRRVLLLHNFIKGTSSLPAHLGEVDQAVAEGFERVFVGHHHDAEEIGLFVMPGSTEIQNLTEAHRQKSVVIYNTRTRKAAFHKLPRTRPVIVLRHELAEFTDRDHLLGTLAKQLSTTDLASTFVCVLLSGQQTPRCSVTKAEVITLLRELNVFDRFVEVRTTSATRSASTAIHGINVDRVVRREFGKNAKKAQRYLESCTDDDFAANIVESILR